MCGRYVSPDEAAIEREFHLDRRNWLPRFRAALDAGFTTNFNVSPTQDVPVLRVIRDTAGVREGLHMRWELIPHWAHGEPTKYSTINARIETVRTNGCYRDAWSRGQRCLVPVKGFYEWQAQPPDWQKTKAIYITVSDQPLFCFAGLWDESVKADGTVVESVTIITMPANELMAEIHNSKKVKGKRVLLPPEERRMPAILAKEDHETWLTGTPDAAFAVLRQYPSELMLSWPTNGRVNSVRNNDPDLILPFEPAPEDSDT